MREWPLIVKIVWLGWLGLWLIFLLWLFSPTTVRAETLSFTWEYPPTAQIPPTDPPAVQTRISGFHLYQDGNILIATILPNVLSVTIPRPEDNQSHVYSLTAFNAAGENGGMSGTVLDIYVAAKAPDMGVLRVKVLP